MWPRVRQPAARVGPGAPRPVLRCGSRPGAPAREPRGQATRRASPGAAVRLLLALLVPLAPAPAAVGVSAAEERFDMDAPPDTPYRLAPWLSLGAELEVDLLLRRNADLDSRRDDRSDTLSPELSVALSFDPAPAFQAFLNVALAGELYLAGAPAGYDPDDEAEIEVKEALVRVRPPGPFELEVGRQRFEDEREWLYDEELDAVRLRARVEALTLEVSVSRNGLVRKNLRSDADRDRITNYTLHARYSLPRDIELEAYAIRRDDRDAGRGHLDFLGVRSRGEPLEDLDYWLEVAYAGGRDGSTRVRGWAIDAGVTYELQRGPRPALTVGLAFGSGDSDPGDGLDRSFRQTGLQENEGDFGGAAGFKYYGEVLDPELSNLAILTVGLGVRPLEALSLDLVYHGYLQHRASTVLRSALDAEPSGRSRTVGHAVDFIVGLEELWGRLDVKGVVGYFRPGTAFPGADDAWLVGAEVQFRF